MFGCSGDTDSVVPVTATRYSIDALKLPTIVNWYPWYDNGKVGANFYSMSNNQSTDTNYVVSVIPLSVS